MLSAGRKTVKNGKRTGDNMIIKLRAATIAVGLAVAISACNRADAAPFTAGNLAVYRTGVAADGTNPTSAAEPVFID